jgi:hypothetical protein
MVGASKKKRAIYKIAQKSPKINNNNKQMRKR